LIEIKGVEREGRLVRMRSRIRPSARNFSGRQIGRNCKQFLSDDFREKLVDWSHPLTRGVIGFAGKIKLRLKTVNEVYDRAYRSVWELSQRSLFKGGWMRGQKYRQATLVHAIRQLRDI
jgi:hypothetical protein